MKYIIEYYDKEKDKIITEEVEASSVIEAFNLIKQKGGLGMHLSYRTYHGRFEISTALADYLIDRLELLKIYSIDDKMKFELDLLKFIIKNFC